MYPPTYPQYMQPYGATQYQQPPVPQQMQQQMPQHMPLSNSQQMQLRGIVGRMVGAPADIAPNEVPMDGSVAYFPTQDGSAIFAKAWNADGTIATVRYAPVPEDAGGDSQAAQQPTLADILDGIDDLRGMIQSAQAPKPARRTAKKEAADDAAD